MDQPSNPAIHECLESLGISRLAEWDVLVFLYRHQASLASAGQIARVMGYPGKVVGDALDRLESLGLVQRSRPSQRVHLYQFTLSKVPPPPLLKKKTAFNN